jgi:hypothetical protein
MDYVERFLPNRTKEESRAEIADDRAARVVADAMKGAFRKRQEREKRLREQCLAPENTDELRTDIKDTLCSS